MRRVDRLAAPPVRRIAEGPSGQVDVAVVLDLLEAACAAGASVPRALEVVGRAVGGPVGHTLRAVAAALLVGATWTEAWAGGPRELDPVAGALGPAWQDGASPGAALRAAAERVRRERSTRALEAAAALGVRLVLPLGLCHLPAFVLVGLVPVLVAMAGGALT